MKRIVSGFLICFLVFSFSISMGIVFAKDVEYSQQEECDGLIEVEQRVLQLEQYIMEQNLEVPAPEAPSFELTELGEGEMAPCDEQVGTAEERIQQLEEYIEENDEQKGNTNAAEKSQGMPSCEEQNGLLEQRVADLEKYIGENGLELPATEGWTAPEEMPEDEKIRGFFKKFFGFFAPKEQT